MVPTEILAAGLILIFLLKESAKLVRNSLNIVRIFSSVAISKKHSADVMS